MNKIEKMADDIRHSYYDIWRVLLFVVAVVLAVYFMPRSVKFKYEFSKMRPWNHETLYAPFNFPIYKTDEQLWKERNDAMANVHLIFVFDEKIADKGREQLIYMFENQYVGAMRDKEMYGDVALRIYDSIQNRGIISNAGAFGNMSSGSIVDVLNNKVVHEISLDEVYNMATASDAVASMLETVSDPEVAKFLDKLILGSLRQNIIFSESLTTQARNRAFDNIMPTFGMVQKDELIISKDEVVTEEKYMIINSLQREYEDMYSNSFFGTNNILFGQIMLVTIVFLCLYVIMKMFYHGIFSQVKRIIMILVLMLLAIIPTFIVLKYKAEWLYMVPISITVMILMTFFEPRVTVIVQIMTLLVICLAVPNPFLFFTEQLFVSISVMFLLAKRKSRSAYFKASLLVFIAYVFINVGAVLMFDGSFDRSFIFNVELFAMNAFLTLLALPLIFAVEKIFRVVTELTLLELSNTNSPLLRRLASEAPGTFQHAMQVADLCEEAIYNIGGNALLVRTGAMYHDVGKLRNPSYFIENQHGTYNPHEDLSNEESAQIIISHVIDGIEICSEYRIPEQIKDFVRTHHGTRRTEYFYVQELHDNPDVDEENFKYHGPIPFSKETAVLMMCDAVEAASRSLKDKTEISINSLVDNIIDGQIKACQFDNTNITYRDVMTVKKVLKKKLINVFHPRVEYPK